MAYEHDTIEKPTNKNTLYSKKANFISHLLIQLTFFLSIIKMFLQTSMSFAHADKVLYILEVYLKIKWIIEKNCEVIKASDNF